MQRSRVFSIALSVVALALLTILSLTESEPFPPVSEMIFWAALLIGAELLPVSLGFRSQVTMAFPIILAVSILFEPSHAMLIVGLGTFDVREIRRQIPLWHALFNRSQMMVTASAASILIDFSGQEPFLFPEGALALSAAALALVFTNLGLVAIQVKFFREISLTAALRSLVPQPVGGFWVAQILIAGLGVVTAAAYHRIGAFVAAFLIPLLFARLGILGARAQQELSERLRQQQAMLLKATEQVFTEREDERKRIAGEIHDGSLQMLAAASYSVGNADAYLQAGQDEEAGQLLDTSRKAIEGAMAALRDSLVDLRRSSVEAGGLMRTIQVYVDQVSMLWGTKVHLEGGVEHEPPVPVALAAFQILQEGLVNALKHANSESIVVRVLDSDNMVHIVVEDDGSGFDPEVEIAADHVGMKLMRERAALVGGRIELHSARGGGTRLEAVLPGGLAQ